MSPRSVGNRLQPQMSRIVGLMIAVASALTAVELTAQTSAGSLAIHVAEPGVYAVPFEAIAPHLPGSRDHREGVPSASLSLTFRNQPLPFWVDDGDDDRLGPGERVVFIASAERLWPPSLHYETPRAVVQLHFDGPELDSPVADDSTSTADDTTSTRAGPADPSEERAGPRRRLRFEKDRFRLPATRNALDILESLWLWTTLSERSSTVHQIELGQLADRARTDPLNLTIRASVVGWSNPEVPDGETQHQVDVRLDDRLVGVARWDGRRTHEIQIDGLSEEALQGSVHRLTLTVPSRPGEAGDPIIDLVHVDWVEVEYRVDLGMPHPSAPLHLPATIEPGQLPGDDEFAEARVLAEAGWSASFQEGEGLEDGGSEGGGSERDRLEGGWHLPPTAETDVWIIGDADLREPLEISPMATPPLPRAGIDYLMIAPSSLLDGARALAGIHERRGLTVDVVDARAVFDTYDWGRRSPDAIRAFLHDQLARSPALRYVLLVGDADWFTPSEATATDELSKLPTGTHFPDSGPAASDHYFAASHEDPIHPRFAIGRLPVTDAASLAIWIDKIRAYLSAPSGEETVLMVSDSTRISEGRSRRVQESLLAEGMKVRSPRSTSEQPLDQQLIAAFDPMPAIVHFSGHGSRHTWQLGVGFGFTGTTFFEREEVDHLPATPRPPMVVSVSCATAPFDHPSADSLGERMILRPDGGAIAFLGASARLYTQPRFGELIVRALLEGRSIGEAMVSAKREVDSADTSALYNLLGDPSLGIR